MFFYRNTHRVLVQMGSWWCLTVRRVSANAAVIQIWYIIHIRYLRIPAGRSKTTYLTLQIQASTLKASFVDFLAASNGALFSKKNYASFQTSLINRPARLFFSKKKCNLQASTVDRGQKLSYIFIGKSIKSCKKTKA